MNISHHKTNRSVFFAFFLILSASVEFHAQAVLTTTEIARTALPSVVLIICDDGTDIVQGSGFFIKPGVIVTNFHVIEGMTRGLAQVADVGNQQKMNLRIARIIAVDREADLALLSVPTAIVKGVIPLTLEPESYVPEVGEVVYALGNPEGLVGTISPGIVSAGLRSTLKKARLQITAPISHGSSGGPVVNDRGRVIGVAVGSLSEGQNLNFAIPVSLLHALIKKSTFPNPAQNSQDKIAEKDEEPPAAWIQNGVSTDGSGNVPNGKADETAAYFFYRGNREYAKGLFAEAIADFTKAIQMNPQDARVYNNRGNAYHKSGNSSLAIADLTRAIRIDPQNAHAYNNRGVVYTDQGNYSFAIADFTKAIDIDPQYAIAYNNRGAAYTDQGNYSFAIADCTKAIQIDPQDVRAYINRGVAHYSLGNYSKAIADFTSAIQMDPQYADQYRNRGLAYCKLGQTSLANADLKKAVELGVTGVKECR